MGKLCRYCGKVNPDDALACGEGQWDGCGGTLPIQAVIGKLPRLPVDTGRYYPSLNIARPLMGTKPHPIPLRTCHRPGKTMRQFQRDIEAMKTEIGLAMLPALQAALRQWGRQ